MSSALQRSIAPPFRLLRCAKLSAPCGEHGELIGSSAAVLESGCTPALPQAVCDPGDLCLPPWHPCTPAAAFIATLSCDCSSVISPSHAELSESRGHLIVPCGWRSTWHIVIS